MASPVTRTFLARTEMDAPSVLVAEESQPSLVMETMGCIVSGGSSVPAEPTEAVERLLACVWWAAITGNRQHEGPDLG